jgi:hypothetical protein
MIASSIASNVTEANALAVDIGNFLGGLNYNAYHDDTQYYLVT